MAAVILAPAPQPRRVGPSPKRLPTSIRRDAVVRDDRDANGRRIKHVFRRHDATGRIGGRETYRPDDGNDARVWPGQVVVTLSAREFGMTQHQLAEVVSRTLVSRPRRTPSGIHLP